jgi:glutathione S-transferase
MDPILSQQDFLVGNQFTAADIINGYTLRLASNLKLLNDAEGTKNVCDYYRRLESRAAFQKAISS